ncbi:iron ABC transporter substrate-binding protein [Desulfosarcina ovata subsp. sediminis]|uniref:Iron ABC transporter substrate-binding protein n=2 Tax=Desulfosarcina ovata TaxID=83564 RepID=A0A5K7ZN17_9BACT|nr:iron ABC transporter substrate-binding protein [Desulfosarcina ovata subsp. sediminis]
MITVGALLLVFILAAGCSDQPAPAKQDVNRRTITDCAGREVRIPERVAKVVDLALLDGTRTMAELQVADRLVGVNDSVKNFMYGEEGSALGCWFLPPKVAPQLKSVLSVGTCREPNVEFIRSLEPDLILAYASYTELADIIEEQTGLPVACIDASGCLDFKMLRLVAEIMGKQRRAEALVTYAKGKVETIVRMRSCLDEKKRAKVFFWGWPVQDAPKTIAPYDPIDLAGGLNVALQAGARPYEIYDITKEQLAVWNPDIILLQWWTRKKVGVRIETILSDPALQTVSAVKNKQIYYSRSFMKGWDPAMGLCEIYYLAKLFYPDLYRDLDVEKEGNEILKRFYGMDGLYSDFLDGSELHRWKPIPTS